MFDQNDQQSQSSVQPQDSNPYATPPDNLSGAPTTSNSLGFDPSVLNTPTTTTNDSPSDPGLNDGIATGSVVSPTTSSSSDDNNDLLNIKQNALKELNPLVQHLEQTPEEKFKTTMMMIQASDDQSLVKTAYEEAQKITDDKSRAQALLDVINEINYFTQQKD
ncbi:MAG: hypothetical protein U0451_03110 [Candidatus Saccharimonadales bacterium]